MGKKDVIELRHLRYFCAIAHAGSFSRAAEALGVQQPPLSQQIRQLEEALGFALFERHRKGVTLTHGGATFLREAETVLLAAREAVTRSRRSADGRVGELRLGVTSSAMAHQLFPEVLRKYRVAYPDVDVRIFEGNAASVTERVHAGTLEAALIRRPVLELSGLQYLTLDVEPMVLLLPQDHELARGPQHRPVGLEALADQRMILVRRPGAMGMYGDLIEAFRRAGIKPMVVAEVEQMLTNIALVAAGVGLSVVPASMTGIHESRVVYRKLDPRLGLEAPLNLVSQARSDNAVLKRFIELVTAVGKPARPRRAGSTASRS